MLLRVLFAVLTGALASAAQNAPSPAAARKLPAQVAAVGRESELTFDDLDALLIARHAAGADGRGILKHLLNARVLDALSRESKLSIGDAEVDARIASIEKDMNASGQKGGLAAYLKQNHVSPSTFREFLRLGLVQETLARRALGVPEGKPVNAEQQEMWLSQVMQQRGLDLPPPPWKDDIAARCGEVSVGAREFAVHLRTELPPETMRDDCFQLLLERRLRARLPDLSDEALQRALDAELARRRAEFESDPKNKGLPFDQAAAANGLRPETLAADPAVRAAALSYVWVDRTFGPEGLKRTYQNERSYFDGRYGEAFAVRILFLRAAVLKNQLNPRSFEEAEQQLGLLRPQLKTEADFKRAAAAQSEDAPSRAKDGAFDWVARGDTRLPAELIARLFPADGAPLADDHRLIGPVRAQGGVLLAWAGEKRETPSWDVLSTAVHRELRKRFMDENLKANEVSTFLDTE